MTTHVRRITKFFEVKKFMFFSDITEKNFHDFINHFNLKYSNLELIFLPLKPFHA